MDYSTDAYDYIAEADATCSAHFNPERVSVDEMKSILIAFIGAAEDMNMLKKLLFRGKTPEELGFDTPTIDASLRAVFVDEADADLVHGIVGVITEAGELAEILRDRIMFGKEFDRINAIEEVGDSLWYHSRILKWARTNFVKVMKHNIGKLNGRHGESFDEERDSNRDLTKEREQLEGFDQATDMALEREHTGNALYDKVHKETSDRLSSMAGRVLADPDSTDEAKSLAGSVLSQDETVGDRQDALAVLQEKGRNAVKDQLTGRTRVDVPAPVDRHTKKPAGDCEGMDC